MRHLRQKPSVRPGLPSRPRPTGSPQFEQYRLFSGTCGSTMIADIGSLYGTGGTSISPAPRLPRRERPVLPPREPRVRLDTEAELRLDTDVDEVRLVPVRVDCDVRTEGAPAAGFCPAGAAAVPQVSQ
ncbi:hypothetical protein GCM10009838_71350 [Catenulispora subtropica]|uniref:Uncharacterized protein n=1 Tax=Catenulispora subtropica TaxID=450798 RepID=A0ABP5EHE2_9ACTN